MLKDRTSAIPIAPRAFLFHTQTEARKGEERVALEPSAEDNNLSMPSLSVLKSRPSLSVYTLLLSVLITPSQYSSLSTFIVLRKRPSVAPKKPASLLLLLVESLLKYAWGTVKENR